MASAASQSAECLSYHMTQKTNPVTPLASPLGEEGHEVAKGCTRVRMIMMLDVDVTAERRHYNTHRPRGRYHNPRPKGPVKLKNPWAEGPSILRTFTPAGRVQSPKNILDIMSPAHYNSHNLRKQTVEAEIKIVRALTGSRGIEKPAGRRLLNGPLRAR